MSDEIILRASLQVRNGNLFEQTQPTGFNIDQAKAVGPSPGVVLVGVNHTLISFAQLPSLGWCWMMNIDATSTVEFGIYSSHFNVFFPLGEMQPGEPAMFRLSRYLGEDLTPGTGTVPSDAFVNSLAMKSIVGPTGAPAAPAEVVVKAFAN